MPCGESFSVGAWVYDKIFSFEAVKTVKIPGTYVGLLYRIIQLLVLVYISVHIVWYNKGYQNFQEPHGSSVIKVKGVAKTRSKALPVEDVFWDTAEYQIPPLENNALFIATRQIITYNQKISNCPSALDKDVYCSAANVSQVCAQGKPAPSTFGFLTGRCVQSSQNATISVCEIRGWCPEELTDSKEYTIDLDDVSNFTVFIKTVVNFADFDITVRNVRDNTNFDCRYGEVADPDLLCPIIRVGHIFDELALSNEIRNELLRSGGLIEIRQKWVCNLDYAAEKCIPKYSFRLLQSPTDKQSPGVNYRSAERYMKDDATYRTLTKFHGLRFVVTITGMGGRFDIVNLFVAIGSGIGYMAIASFVCEYIFSTFHWSREKYNENQCSICEVDESKIKEILMKENSKKENDSVRTNGGYCDNDNF